ncbi:MAG: fibronectin type III domain-containing protein [Candidatus Scalindua sp.]|nr:fibronectin type III domain-containing protein [Candidatus Scalindua sp.]
MRLLPDTVWLTCKEGLRSLSQGIFICLFTLTVAFLLCGTGVCSAKDDFYVVNLGDNIAFNPTASDPDGDTLSFSYSGWMSSSGYVTRFGDAGTHTVTVSVNDGSLSDSRDVAVNVNFLSQVTLTWDPNSESDLAGYKLHYGTTSGSPNLVLDVGNQTFGTIPNLISGQTYYISVTAYDTSGNESTSLSEVIHIVPTFVDSDGDGAPDSQDAFPSDPSKIA